MQKIVILLFFLSLFSCKENSKNAVDSDAKSKGDASDLVSIQEVVVDSVFKLSLPDFMKKMTSLNDEASLQYAHVFKEMYAIVIYEDKHQFKNSYKEFGEYNDEISFIENYANAQTNYFKESVENLKVIPYNVNKIGELNASQIMMKGSIDGENIGYVIGYVEGKDNVFMIMTWTLQDRLSKYEQTFKDIIGSFELIK